MRVIERMIQHPSQEGVILEYFKFTKDFAEIKEYVKHKGDTIMGYTQNNACVSIRIEDMACSYNRKKQKKQTKIIKFL